jgi:hypothetical protein
MSWLAHRQTALERQLSQLRPSDWPPPPSQQHPWRRRRFYVNRSGHVTSFGQSTVVIPVRTVPLWGREVTINEEGEVFCNGCWTFLSLDQLLEPGSSHRVGPPVALAGLTVPVSFEDEPRRRRPRWETEGF